MQFIALLIGELLAIKFKDSPNTYLQFGALLIFVTKIIYWLLEAYYIPFSLLIWLHLHT